MWRIPVVLSALGLLLLGPSVALAECDDLDPSTPSNDCDEDGFTIGEGDCDDDSELVAPDLDEVCGDGLDNNCDNVVDEECDVFPDDVILSGGGQCGLAFSVSGMSTAVTAMFVIARRERRCL